MVVVDPLLLRLPSPTATEHGVRILRLSDIERPFYLRMRVWKLIHEQESCAHRRGTCLDDPPCDE